MLTLRIIYSGVYCIVWISGWKNFGESVVPWIWRGKLWPIYSILCYNNFAFLVENFNRSICAPSQSLFTTSLVSQTLPGHLLKHWYKHQHVNIGHNCTVDLLVITSVSCHITMLSSILQLFYIGHTSSFILSLRSWLDASHCHPITNLVNQACSS